MLTLAENKKTRYVIAVAADAAPVERHAARELARYLKKITGATFPVVAPAAVESRPCVAVGPGAAVATGLLKEPPGALGNEGTLRRTVGESLVLCGGAGALRGTFYAVTSFLEEDLGCRWWTPTAEYVPRCPTLMIPQCDRQYVPPFDYRETLYRNVFEVQWAAHNRTNAYWRLPKKLGGYIHYEGWCHTFSGLAPVDPYFQTHPEWFAEVNGQRTCADAQLCLTNPELTAHVIAELKRRLRLSHATHTSVSQNDCAGYCQCPRCRALNEAADSPAGSLVHFLNAVAVGLADEFPEVIVETLAYAYSRRAPRGVKIHPNVAVRLCSYECDFLHPFDHVNNRPFHEDLLGWTQVCARVYIWDYVTNFENYVQPHPNWYTLGANMRYFLAHQAKGVFSQGNNCSLGGEMAELRAWVLAKLLWDPHRDDAALIREFLTGYYGRAANHVEAYLRLVHGAAAAIPFYGGSYLIERCHVRRGTPNPAREGLYLDLGATWDAPFLAPEIMLEALRHLAAAESAVAGDPVLRERVALARLPVLFVVLVRWNEMRQYARRTRQRWLLPASRAAAGRQFATVAKRAGMTQLKEGGSRDLPWLARVCAGKTTPEP